LPWTVLLLTLAVAIAMLVTSTAIAATRSFAPSQRHGKMIVFKLKGIAPEEVRAGYLKLGGHKRKLDLERVLKAARKGVLRLRVRTRRHKKPTLIIVTSKVALLTTGATSTAFAPNADSYTGADRPHRNYGAATILRPDRSPARNGYLRFDVSGLKAPVTKAALRVYTHSSSSTGITLHGVTSKAWTESRITYANAPAIGSAVASSGKMTSGSYVSLDATSLVKGNGTVTMGLKTISSSSKRLDSREGANKPSLVVETAPPAPPPPPPSGNDPVIAAAGDIACDPADGNFNLGNGTTGACRQKYTSDLLVGAGLAKVLALGDNQYEDNQLIKYLTAYDPTWGRVKSLIRPAIGNHEYQTSAAAGYFDYFNGTGVTSGPAGDRGKGYYSFDVGAWHLISLNSNCSQVSCSAGSPQEQWLRSDLAAHSNACTLAYWHHPRYSSGTHGNNSSVQPLWQALYEGNADVVLNGHDHVYERFSPQNAGGAADSSRGIREFVVGTGGKNHYSFSTPLPNSEVRNADTYGVMKLTLHASGYDWRFTPEAGKSFGDSGSDVCH
jgi:calcineurin-like phosphoesterase family protein